MSKKSLNKENYFDTSITGVNDVGSTITTPNFAGFSSPDVSQDPSNFGVFHVTNQSDANAFYNRLEDKEEDALNFNIPIEDALYIIYSRDVIPHPDEFMVGMQYEIQKMLIPDVDLARRRVLMNVLKDPAYYSKLRMLNIDDSLMEHKEDKTVNNINFNKIFNLLETLALIKNKLLS